LIDYAGLFPPASLPLDAAIRLYAGYRDGADAWMLGRFICPAARLTELDPYPAELATAARPLVVSALGRGGAAAAAFRAGLQADLAAISAFRQRHGDRVRVDVLETKLPGPGAEGVATAAELLAGHGLTVFHEAPLGPTYREGLPGLVLALKAAGAGLKVRCGGTVATAFPPAELIAAALVPCRDHGVPFKATAGLHHPVRHFRPEFGVPMHGFLNVFGAGVLAHARRLAEAEVLAVLLEDDPQAFRCDGDHFRVRQHSATAVEIQAARRELATSFGSCSFDEPREDLRHLGLSPG
jgi:hypothetical protein